MLISLVSYDLNLVFEKVQELLGMAYYTFLAFLERISSMDWSKKSSPSLFSKKPTMPFLRRISISSLVSCFSA
jgi:hypothetical protein